MARGDATKIILDDTLLGLVRTAKQRVYELALEEDWLPSLEIGLPEGGSIQVSANNFERMGQGQQVIAILSGNAYDGITAMIGDYGYEGWETALHRDVLEVPDLYFDRMFVVYLKDSSLQWKCIEPEHRKTALACLYRYLHHDIKWGYRNSDKLKKMAEQVKKVYKGQASYDTLMRSIDRTKLW